MNFIKGIDVGYPEPVVDFEKVKQAGYYFAFIRTSQGSVEDSLFKTHWANAKKAGMPRGAYHVYDPRYTSVTPVIQAQTFWNLIKNDPPELPLAIDIEKYTSGPYFGSDYWYQFIYALKLLCGGREIIIYSAKYYWQDNVLKPKAAADPYWFSDNFELWIANYTNNPETPPSMPFYWNRYLFYQYSESGLVDGVVDPLGRPTGCDLNIFPGTLEEFIHRFKLNVPVPPDPDPLPQPETGDTLYKAYVKYGVYSLNVRTYPTVSGDTVSGCYLKFPDVIYGKTYDDGTYLWLKIEQSNDPNIVGKWATVRTKDGFDVFMELYLPDPIIKYVLPDQFTTYEFSLSDLSDKHVRKILNPLAYSVPAVFNTGESEGHKNWTWAVMTKVIQFFWVDILAMYLYKKLYKNLSSSEKKYVRGRFEALTKSNEFLTNDKGTDKFRNYVSDTNKGKDDPKQAPLICANDWVRVLQVKTNSKGIQMAQIDSFLASEPLPPVTFDLLKDPRIMWATTINRDGGIGNFPQLKSKPVPYPYITNQHWWYPIVDLGEIK